MTSLSRPDFSRSLLALANRILTDLGCDPVHEPLSIAWPDTDIIVLWIVDGLGWNHITTALQNHDLPFCQTQIERGLSRSLLKLNSVFPSTTVTALATLHFAEPPSEHGALGYTLWDPEIMRTINLLTSKDLTGRVCQSSLYQQRPTLYDRLHQHQVKGTVISPEIFRHSALSAWFYHGAQYLGYHTPAEIPYLVQQAISNESRLVTVYWPGFDAISHVHGPTSSSAPIELQLLDWIISKTQEQIFPQAHVRFVMTADHGSIALTAPKHATDHLLSRLYAGERRALYTAWSCEELKQELAALEWSDAVSLPNELLWEEGWFGGRPQDSTFRLRTLQTTLLPPKDQQVAMPEPEPKILMGGHGGWSEAEREIFLAWWDVH
ncbi:alkaline phosphatase family protein [Sulfobacillus thermosulfidooxidans]|uniref:alkaline phosphatase family protein n=1 Tax=Sulfobacillus thermosulfidooxidans TaxID=28034 RepID=UPI00096B83C0|nr:alkaline phosphatase family protein [Sulfobacillus thermosulfidooxidans]OLZ08364.1 hypothetical protein BFX05_03810 [Sulfobacillus thermosulfidooxidans]OLZ13915.1 hypothetical protein BFX06_06270 [Sulfobacillus thermosulfidooxidans]OLZ20533.1 hypothetical protein BFX07_15065 [Sulfobacillus thermosulfidooxidans]